MLVMMVMMMNCVWCTDPRKQFSKMMMMKVMNDVCDGQDWVVLGALDLDQFVQDNLAIISDWERNFRALKARGRDAEKLPR